jgi:hypothetical protein
LETWSWLQWCLVGEYFSLSEHPSY